LLSAVETFRLWLDISCVYGVLHMADSELGMDALCDDPFRVVYDALYGDDPGDHALIVCLCCELNVMTEVPLFMLVSLSLFIRVIPLFDPFSVVHACC